MDTSHHGPSGRLWYAIRSMGVTVLWRCAKRWITGSNVIIECDGWTAHGIDHDQFEFDRFRDADLLAKGVITQRVTWRQMVRTARAVAGRIRATLAQWSPDVLFAATPSPSDRRDIRGGC